MFLATSNSSYNPMIHIENALANIIRRENPLLSEHEVKSLVPGMQTQLQEQMGRGDLIVTFLFCIVIHLTTKSNF